MLRAIESSHANYGGIDMDEINRRWQLVRMDAGPFIVFACGFLMGVVAMAALLRGIGLS